ncbi:MAG TPA: hypothetical protein GX513_03880 [Firmicutes bacterium]|nr:hypothetical protein [Bacillota bacterium]
MKRYRVVFEPEAPILVGGETRDSVVREARDWIPGSTWRGAFAEALLRDQGCFREWGREGGRTCPSCTETSSCHLPRLVHEGRFLPLYPIGKVELGDVKEDWIPAHLVSGAIELSPAPNSGRMCKQNETHPLRDLLIGDLVDLLRNGGLGKVSGSDRAECQECCGRLDRLRGTLRQHGRGPSATFRKVKVSRRLQTNVGLSRRTGKAEDEILFAVRPMIDVDAFVGDLVVPDAVADWLGTSSEPRRISLGGGKARGLGAGTLHLHTVDRSEDLVERLKAFQPTDGADLLDEAHLYFCLDLQSAALLFSDSAGPARHLTPPVLSRYCPSEFGELLRTVEQLPLSYTEQTATSGWSQTWGLYKPVFFTIAPGSVFVYRVPVAYRDTLVRLLAWMESRGLGENRLQGFGEVAVCHWFHFCAGGGTE